MSRFAFKALAAGAFVGAVALFSWQAADPPLAPFFSSAARAQPANEGRPAGPSWVEGPSFSARGRVTALAAGPGVVAVGDDQAHLTLWDVKTGKEVIKTGTDGGEQESIDGLRVSRDGQQLFVILNRGGAMHQVGIRKEGRDWVGFADSGDWVYYGTTGDDRHWLGRKTANHELLLLKNDPAQKKFETTVAARFTHAEKITHATGDADVVVSVSGLSKATLHRWQPDREKALWEVDLGGTDVTGVLVLPGAKRVAVTGDAGFVRVFDAATGKLVSKADGLTGIISAGASDSGGKWLVVGCRDGSARVLDTETGKVLATLKGHSDRVLAVAVGPDGAIATGGADKRVKVWKPRN